MTEDPNKALNRTNVEQAKAAQKAQYDAAAEAVFQVEMKDVSDRTAGDREAIQGHKNNLVRFADELMDDRFRGEVSDLIKKCNDILDAPIKGMI